MVAQMRVTGQVLGDEDFESIALYQQDGGLTRYKVRGTLGTGAEGEVLLVEKPNSGDVAALKVIRRKRRRCEDVEMQTKLLSLPVHPNVVRIKEVITRETGEQFYFMDYCDGGDLFNAIQQSDEKRFDEATAASILLQVVSGLRHCHAHNIFHGDIKLENILLHNGVARLCDFGSAINVTRSPSRVSRGSELYSAPEIMENPHYDAAKADVWALGVTLFAMNAGVHPWKVARSSDPLYGHFLREAGHPESFCPPHFSACLIDLLQGMLCSDPSRRFSLEEVATHNWVARSIVSDSVHRALRAPRKERLSKYTCEERARTQISSKVVPRESIIARRSLSERKGIQCRIDCRNSMMQIPVSSFKQGKLSPKRPCLRIEDI